MCKNGYTLLCATTRNQLELEQRCLRQMLDSHVDGVIIEPTKSALPTPNVALLRQLGQAGIVSYCYTEINFLQYRPNIGFLYAVNFAMI